MINTHTHTHLSQYKHVSSMTHLIDIIKICSKFNNNNNNNEGVWSVINREKERERESARAVSILPQ